MADDNRSFPELFSTASAQLARLVRAEVQLAKAELTSSVGNAGTAVALVGSGLGVAIAALVLVLMAVSAWLERAGLSEPAANLLTAVVGLAVGGGLAWAGTNKLRSNSIIPSKTVEQVSEDAAAIKDQLK